MSYEDSFARDAADARAYEGFERWYISTKMQPASIGKWEWLLMFNGLPSYKSYTAASDAAKEMARELDRCVDIQMIYEGTFKAVPEDYYRYPDGPYAWTYQVKRHDFIKSLVVAGTYPDLVSIARHMNDARRHGIASHFLDTVSRNHQRWLEQSAVTLTPEAELVPARKNL